MPIQEDFFFKKEKRQLDTSVPEEMCWWWHLVSVRVWSSAPPRQVSDQDASCGWLKINK